MEMVDFKRYIAIIIIIAFRIILNINNTDLPKNTDVSSLYKILIIDLDLESLGSDLQ